MVALCRSHHAENITAVMIDIYVVRRGRFDYAASVPIPARYHPQAVVVNGIGKPGLSFTVELSQSGLNAHFPVARVHSLLELMSVEINNGFGRGGILIDADDEDNTIHRLPIVMEWRIQ